MRDILGKLFLILDGHGSHTSGETRRLFRDNVDYLSVFFLPSYFSELNSDEWIWNNVKCDEIGRLALRTRDELQERVACKRLAKSSSGSSVIRTLPASAPKGRRTGVLSPDRVIILKPGS